MVFHTKEKLLQLDRSKIRYITFGNGCKTLIMIQGLNTRDIKGAAFALAYMYRIFSKDYTVYLFDRRDEISEDLTVRELAEDIARAMDALGLKAADVFGVSQGGMIAQYLAIDRPDLVNKLVLAVTLSRNNDTVKSVVENWIKMTESGDMMALVSDMAEKMYSDTYIKKYRPFLPLMTVLQRPKDVHRFVILAKSCLTCDSYDLLGKITCPVFVIGGRQDQVVTAKASEEIAEKLGCKLFLYDGLGHAAYEEAPDFNRRVLAFFRE